MIPDQERHAAIEGAFRTNSAATLLIETPGVLQFGQFRFNSGLDSPMKIETDQLRAHPEAHRQISQYLVEIIQEQQLNPTVVVGVITGGVSFAQEVAGILGVKFAARLGNTETPQKRQYLEGQIVAGDRVVVVEDVVTTGTNTTSCCYQIEKELGRVVMCLAIFNYEFRVAEEQFQRLFLPHTYLVGFSHLTQLLEVKGNPDLSLVTNLRSWHNYANQTLSNRFNSTH